MRTELAKAILSLATAFLICCAIGGRCGLGAEGQGARIAVGQAGVGLPHPVFDIPKVDKPTIDGNPAGWGDGGFRVDVLAAADGFVPPEGRFSARMRLGWNDQGLLVLVQTREASSRECFDEKEMEMGNSVELFMLDKPGGSEMIKATISPGMDPVHPELRYRIEDSRKDEALRKVLPTLTAVRTKQEGGYTLEALLPWENVGVKSQPGAELAFQICINDYAEDAPNVHAVWYPATGTQAVSDGAHRIRLALAPSPPVRAAGRARYDGWRYTRAVVLADSESAGRAVSVLADGREIARAVLIRDGARSMAELKAPWSPIGSDWKSLSILLDGETIDTVPMPDLARARADAAARMRFQFVPACFAGKTFPGGDFESPLEAERAFGCYSTSVTYYDAQFNPVTSADKPGRYAAVVEVAPQFVPAFKRYCILFRTAGELELRDLEVPASLSKEMGIAPGVAREQQPLLAHYLRDETADAFRHSVYGVMLLAWLHEAKPGEVANERTGPESRACEFIHELKRRTGNLTPLQYYVQMPARADRGGAKKWPAIVYLHGMGLIGLDVNDVTSSFVVQYARRTSDFPFIVFAPRCPAGGRWYKLIPELADLLDEIVAKYPVDTDRIYLTGASMGGFACWRLAAEHPDRFAAVVPVCGGGDPGDVERIKDLPLWDFHGAKDPGVSIQASYEMVEALRKVHGRVRFTVYANGDHFISTRTYNTAALYAWMLAQSRGNPAEPRTTLSGSAPTETLP